VECVPPPPCLTNWWPFDTGPADIVGGQNAVLHDNAAIGPGFVAGALGLDGSDDFASVPSTPALNLGTRDFTADLWVNFHTAAGEQVLLEKYIETFSARRTGFTFTKLANNVIRVHLGGGGDADVIDSAPLALPANTWIFFALRRSGNTFTTFMNGTPIAS